MSESVARAARAELPAPSNGKRIGKADREGSKMRDFIWRWRMKALLWLAGGGSYMLNCRIDHWEGGVVRIGPSASFASKPSGQMEIVGITMAARKIASAFITMHTPDSLDAPPEQS